MRSRKLHGAMVYIACVLIILAMAYLCFRLTRSGLEAGEAGRYRTMTPGKIIDQVPDACFAEIEVSELDPDKRTARVEVQQVYLEPEDLEPDGPEETPPAALNAPCTAKFLDSYSKLARQYASGDGIGRDQIETAFGPILLFDLFGGVRNVEAQAALDFKDQPYTKQPQHSIEGINVAGNPTLFPFDSYKADFFLLTQAAILYRRDHSILFSIPFATVRSNEDLPSFIVSEKSLDIIKDDDLNEALDQSFIPHLRYTFRRPVALRALALIVGLISLIASIGLFFSPKKEIVRNVVAFFLTLWALKNVLESGAPKTVTMLDYAFISFVLLIGVGLLCRLAILWQHAKSLA